MVCSTMIYDSLALSMILYDNIIIMCRIMEKFEVKMQIKTFLGLFYYYNIMLYCYCIMIIFVTTTVMSLGEPSYPPVPVVPRYCVVLFRFGWPTVVRQPASDYDGGHANQQRQYYVQFGFTWNKILPSVVITKEKRTIYFLCIVYFTMLCINVL